jgi:hypothetical protein
MEAITIQSLILAGPVSITIMFILMRLVAQAELLKEGISFFKLEVSYHKTPGDQMKKKYALENPGVFNSKDSAYLKIKDHHEKSYV